MSRILISFLFAAIPQYNTVAAIRQYVFSDSLTAQIECPLELGRLHATIVPYEFSWLLKSETKESLVANGSNSGTFHLSDNNRTLNIYFPTPRQANVYAFLCNGRIRRCNSTSGDNINVCVIQNTNRDSTPFIMLEFVGK